MRRPALTPRDTAVMALGLVAVLVFMLWANRAVQVVSVAIFLLCFLYLLVQRRRGHL